MIPKNISADHILKAIDRMRAEGYPEARASTRFDLLFEGDRFPPKVVISYANVFANGAELSETEFSGGDESNRFLAGLGFQIVPKDSVPSRRAWIFQANPDAFDIDAYLAEETNITWTARQRAGDMQVGDHVFLWRAAGAKNAESGVIASASITEPPRVRPEDSTALRYWRSGTPKDERRVRLEVDRVANARQVVKRAWLTDDPVLAELLILKMGTRTNYVLPQNQAKRLDDLWRNTGRDWNRAESLAGLWAYSQTHGQSISRGVDSVVTQVALQIGRAVSGVYNKVMNFRAIDPRDERAGLAGAGDTDRKVWEEFYDPKTKRLRETELDLEYRRLWLDEQPEPSESDQEAKSVASLVVDPDETVYPGQGYVLDKWKRKAIELRAMELAQQHYEARGYAVRDTSASRPYDLLCVRGSEEIRVEVKGTCGTGDRVKLTIGEVNNARGQGWRTDIFIVYRIEIEGAGRNVAAISGESRVIENWSPLPRDLSPLTFEYRVS